MHDGSKKTLEDVVEFYYCGVPASAVGLPVDGRPLNDRSFSEIPLIVAFLESLTGEAPRVDAPNLP